MESNHSVNIDVLNSNSLLLSCPICMEEITEEEKCITECNHHFCKTCIHTWFERNVVSCPSCRGEIKYYINNLEKNHIVKVRPSNNNQLNVNNVNHVNNVNNDLLRGRLRVYQYLLYINSFFMMYSFYEGFQMTGVINHCENDYNNCTRALEEKEHQYDVMSRVMVYINQVYKSCDIPNYFLNQCIPSFDTIV